jgi:2-iminobutanoate/2-iminopropanoate deaminase
MDHLIVEGAVPPPGGAYSHGVVAGDLLFTAGFGPFSPGGELVGATVAEQTTQVIRNLESVLAARGRTLADVVKATVHLAELERDFAEFDATYRALMPTPYPVRTTVGSALLGILVEIDFVARA